MKHVPTTSAILFVAFALTACNRKVVIHAGMPLAEAQGVVEDADLEVYAMPAMHVEGDGTTTPSPIAVYMLDKSTGFTLSESKAIPNTLGDIRVFHGLDGPKGTYVVDSRSELRLP